MLLSILTPTLDERRPALERLHGALRRQVADRHLENDVELLALCDNRESTTGAKRNSLLARAAGEFTVFVDDDDDVHEDYVGVIAAALRSHPEVDCLGISGIVDFRGRRPRRFVHSLRYREYTTVGGVYCRPPYILNPMRRRIAASFAFADVSYAEDADWALRIARAGALRAEHWIGDIVLYRYHSRRSPWVQRAIDWSEPLRHPLGLQSANRVRLMRRLRREGP